MWKLLHPDWEHRLWNFHNLPEIQNQDLFDAATSYATKTDILRYELMHRYGGVYADFDVEPLKPFDPLLNHRGFIGRMKPSFEQIVVQEIEIAVIGSEPGNRIWEQVIRALPEWVERHKAIGNLATRTGPQFRAIAR